MTTDLALAAAAFGVGVLVGLTSMGSATLMAPFLVLLLGVRPVIAVGVDLAYGAITKSIGALLHLRQRTVDLRAAAQLAAGSLPGGLIGSFWVVWFGAQRRLTVDQDVRRALGVVLIAIAAQFVYWIVRPQAAKPMPRPVSPWMLRSAGFVTGLCVGLTSVGSGTLLVPILMMLYPSRPAEVVGTAVFHAAILLAVTGLAQSAAGHIDWKLVAILLSGSVPGVLMGSRLAPRMPVKALRIVLTAVLLASGVKLVWR